MKYGIHRPIAMFKSQFINRSEKKIIVNEFLGTVRALPVFVPWLKRRREKKTRKIATGIKSSTCIYIYLQPIGDNTEYHAIPIYNIHASKSCSMPTANDIKIE